MEPRLRNHARRSSATSMTTIICIFWVSLAAAAEPYQFGTLTADVPEDWFSTEVVLPGTILVSFYEGPDPEETTAVLFWIETTPLDSVSPREFAKAVVDSIGLVDVNMQSENSASRNLALIIDAEFEHEPVTASIYSFERNERLYVYALIAEPTRFVELGGAKMPLVVFNEGEVLVGKAAEKPPNAVLATAPGHELTQKKIDDGLAFIEFLAAQDISAEDKRALRQKMIAEFPTASTKDLVAYDDISTLMGKLREMSRSERAVWRRDLTSQVWFNEKRDEDGQELVDLIFKYNPVLGADEQLGLVVTRAGYDALLASNSFIAASAGLSPVTAAQGDRAAEQLKREFASLDTRQKRYLNDAEVNWLKVVAAWPLWDEQQQLKNLQIVGLDGIQTPDHVPQVARNLEHWAGMAVNNDQIMSAVGMQGKMMALAHLRGMLSRGD